MKPLYVECNNEFILSFDTLETGYLFYIDNDKNKCRFKKTTLSEYLNTIAYCKLTGDTVTFGIGGVNGWLKITEKQFFNILNGVHPLDTVSNQPL